MHNILSDLSDVWKIGSYLLGRKHFFKGCAPRKMMQNGIDEIFWGRTFKKTSYFNLRALEHWPRCLMHSQFQLCIIRQKPVALQVFTAPIFFEAPNLWVRCSRLLGFFNLWYVVQGCFYQKKGFHISGSP